MGFNQKRVLPEPLPPTIRTFLFRAVFGSLGRLFIVSRSVCVRMMSVSYTHLHKRDVLHQNGVDGNADDDEKCLEARCV